MEEAFIEDNYRPTSWLTLIGGERQTHFQASISENAIYPRIGMAVQIPKLGWVLRGFYGHFYQPPPLTSLSGPALAYAQGNNTSFVPCAANATRNTSSECRFPGAAGCSTRTLSRPAPTIFSTTAISASPASSFRSLCRAR